MFDNDCNLNTISGTLDYCRKRGFIKKCDCFNPFNIYDKIGGCSCFEDSEYYSENIDAFDRLEAGFGTSVPNITNYNEDLCEEIVSKDNFRIDSDILSLPEYIVPYNVPLSLPYETPKPESPVKVKLSVRDNKYDITYSNIRNNNIYGIEMAGKKIDEDLFKDLTYHYTQRQFIKNKSKLIVDSALPQKTKLDKNDVLKIHNKVFVVERFNANVARHELREISTQKLYEYNLALIPFSVIMTNKLKEDIIFFDLERLLRVELAEDSYTNNYGDNESHNSISLSSSSVNILDDIPEEISQDVDKTIEIIDNYFASCIDTESIFKIDTTTSVPKIIVYTDNEEDGYGKPQPLIKDVTGEDENTDDLNKDDESENTAGGYCTVM